MQDVKENMSTMSEIKEEPNDTSTKSIPSGNDKPYISNRKKKENLKRQKAIMHYVMKMQARDQYRLKKRLERREERLRFKKARQIYFKNK